MKNLHSYMLAAQHAYWSAEADRWRDLAAAHTEWEWPFGIQQATAEAVEAEALAAFFAPALERGHA